MNKCTNKWLKSKVVNGQIKKIINEYIWVNNTIKNK